MDPKVIVVVNDDPTQLRMLAGVIERFGYKVLPFTDPTRLLDSLAAGIHVDLFITDLRMPGIDGWKLCRLLRSPDFERYNATPVLVVSATFTGVDVEAITNELGANAFLPLPFSREDLLEYIVDLLQGKRPRRRSRVLIVEDHPPLARALSLAFEAHGFTVDVAPSAAAAIAAWDERPTDVVVLDYHLPDSTCEALVSRISAPAAQTVVIVMTGDTDLQIPVSVLRLGADGFVRKPFDPALVVELARRAQRERALLRVEAVLEERTRQLNASERRYRSLFEAIPDLVLLLDREGRIRKVSHNLTSVLGIGADALRGSAFIDLVPEAEALQVAQAIEQVWSAGVGGFETRLVGADGEIVAEITGTTTEDQDRAALLLVARDQTWRREAEEERRRLQQQVHHAQRLDSLGVLAGGIAHDFNNLLVGILGNANLAALEVDDPDTVRECITHIEKAAMRAAELTQQILTFSGKSRSVTQAVSLAEVVAEMGQLLERAVSTDAKLVYDLPESLPPIQGDPSQIRQIVMNLIMNASDALHGRPGTVTVRAHEETIDERALRRFTLGESARPGHYACLEVTDDGCGMDRATVQQIFDPFFTTKPSGRGLGLAATLGIVRSHRGLLAVDSEPGRGTSFRILFPYPPETRRAATDGATLAQGLGEEQAQRVSASVR